MRFVAGLFDFYGRSKKAPCGGVVGLKPSLPKEGGTAERRWEDFSMKNCAYWNIKGEIYF